MPQIEISSASISQVLWSGWVREFSWDLKPRIAELTEIGRTLNADATKMSSVTGSISLGTAISLYLISRKIAPKTIFEVGTYIGRSAAALGLGMSDAGVTGGCVFTCDAANDFVMSTAHFPFKVRGYPRMLGTAAMRDMIEKGHSVDLFHFDGRLTQDDPELVARLAHDETVIAIDDFEGIEKGVFNAMLLKQAPRFASYVLIYPPQPEVLQSLGILSGSVTALLLPPRLFRLTSQ